MMTNRVPRFAAFSAIAVIAVIGTWLLLMARAQPSSYGQEAEDGQRSANTSLKTDASASNNSAVVFAPAVMDYDNLVLADHPTAYWAMGSSSATEPDASGNSHTGTYNGGLPGKSVLPNNDPVNVFNGNGQYLSIPSSSAFSVTTTQRLTWEAWIRPTTLEFPNNTDGYIDWMGKCQDYSPTCEWEARMYASTNPQGRCNRISAYIFNPGAGLGSAADWQPSCNLLQAGKWLHIVGEYQTSTTPAGCNGSYPGSISIWVNAIQWNMSYHSPTGCMSQYSVIPAAGNSPLNIGTMAMDAWFPGAIGKVALYDYLLTPAQITAHYSSMTSLAPTGSCANTCTMPIN